MKLTTSRLGVLGLAALLFVSAAHASGLVADWQFNDARGTRLNAIKEEVAGIQFNRSARGVQTTGDGALRVRRDRPRGAYYAAPLEIDPARPVWMVVEIRGWQLEGEANEVIRFDLSEDTGQNQGVAGIRLSRSENNEIVVEGRSEGHRSRVRARPLFANPSTGPVALALELQPADNRYIVHYREGSGSWTRMGAGRTVADRSVKFLRLFVMNQMNDTPQEHFDISRIYVTYDNPL